MNVNKARQDFFDQVSTAQDRFSGVEIDALRTELIQRIYDENRNFQNFLEQAIAYWRAWLQVDRIFLCDMKDGAVIAGWNLGKNLAKLQDWDPQYVPLEDDVTLQLALESDELIAAPVDGQGADLAFSIHLSEQRHLLVVFDQTDVARVFSPGDMARVLLVRDLIVLKYQFQKQTP